MTDKELYRLAESARKYSYSPYSYFRVGAALIAADDFGEEKVFTGCNVENASYGGTICAERTAAVKAVSEGYTHFRAIAVAGGFAEESEAPSVDARAESSPVAENTYPCGICLQFLSEFADSTIRIVMHDRTVTLEDLMPNTFRL